MFSSDFIKFFIFLALVLPLFSSCRYGQKTEGETSSPKPFIAEEIKSEIPFSTKEPEIFQTEIAVSANGQERVCFIAKNVANHRFDYNYGRKNQVSVLQTDKNYLVFPDKKIYTVSAGGENVFATDSWTDFITTKWINERTETVYERLETENDLTKYRVRFAESETSESLIYVDENQKIPIRQEFYSVNGDQKILNYSVELRNLKLRTDDNTFSIPKDFRLVTIVEFRKISRNAQP